MSHMATSQSPTSAASILTQLINDELVSVPMCTPVYSDGAGSFKMALGDGSAKSKVIGVVVDPSVPATKLGSVLRVGFVTATPAQWDAVCGTSGGLAYGTLYYLSTTVPGVLVTSAASNVPVIFGLGLNVGAIVTGGSSSGGGISNLIMPSITPTALANDFNTPYLDWDPWSGSPPTQATCVRVTAHNNGSVLQGLFPGVAGSVAHGTIVVLHNIAGPNAQNSANLFIAQDTPGNTYPFHLVGRRPVLCIPSLGMAMFRFDETDKWFCIGHYGVEDMIRSITVPVAAGATLNNWDPVDGTTGLSFRYSNHIYIAPAGIGVTLNSMKMKSGPGSSPPGSSYGYRFAMTNAGSGFTIKNFGGGGGTSFRTPGGTDYIMPNQGTQWFWYDFDNDVIYPESCRIGGQ